MVRWFHQRLLSWHRRCCHGQCAVTSAAAPPPVPRAASAALQQPPHRPQCAPHGGAVKSRRHQPPCSASLVTHPPPGGRQFPLFQTRTPGSGPYRAHARPGQAPPRPTPRWLPVPPTARCIDHRCRHRPCTPLLARPATRGPAGYSLDWGTLPRPAHRPPASRRGCQRPLLNAATRAPVGGAPPPPSAATPSGTSSRLNAS